MKIKEGFLLRNVAGNDVVVPTGKAAVAFHGMMALNGVAAFLWKKLQSDISRDGLLEALLAEYDVECEKAAADVDAFIASLKEKDLLEA